MFYSTPKFSKLRFLYSCALNTISYIFRKFFIPLFSNFTHSLFLYFVHIIPLFSIPPPPFRTGFQWSTQSQWSWNVNPDRTCMWSTQSHSSQNFWMVGYYLIVKFGHWIPTCAAPLFAIMICWSPVAQSIVRFSVLLRRTEDGLLILPHPISLLPYQSPAETKWLISCT
jgi:hypothetical protein